MNVEDFLPYYTDIESNEFNPSIFHKKEFYENKLQLNEKIPIERGVLANHQKNIARYMSSRTPYDGVLLVHAMGSGKSCATIGAIEQIRSENSTIDGAAIFASGDKMLNNFKNEIVFKCTHGQ